MCLSNDVDGCGIFSYYRVSLQKGENMKKTLFVGLVAVLAVSSAANAGWLESLGFGKKAEPATLEEACDTDEIKKVCPEIVLGTKTIPECLSENVKSLSSKCAKYVKKSMSDKVAAVKQGIADKKAETAEQKAVQKQAIEDKKAEVKEKIAAAKTAAAEKKVADKKAKEEKKAAAKEKVEAQKAAAKAAGNEIADAVRETGESAKETGHALKSLF